MKNDHFTKIDVEQVLDLGIEGTDLDLSLVGKEGKKLNVGIVGFGPAGIITAISLSK